VGSKKPKVEVVEYYMSIHYGVCAGPVDAFLSLFVGEKEAWSGELTVPTHVMIDKSDLFGGVKKEGGVRGLMTYLPGNSTQVLGEYLSAKLGLTSATAPAYRGLTSLFFTAGGSELNFPVVDTTAPVGEGDFSLAEAIFVNIFGGTLGSGNGFYWQANSPYIQPAWVTVRRRPKGLPEETAMIGPDANGMHIAYEVLTNTDWGIGTAPGSLDTDAFEACAQTLFDEGFGMSLLWSQQASAEDFIGTILGHIGAVMFLNPRTGLLTPKLIRDDYDPDDLFEINPGNATVSGYQRKLWGETINEIIVTWTNPVNEETETVQIQDLANIAAQGSVVSDSREYAGIRNSELAMRLAARDLRVASAPLMSCDAVVNRNAWDITPGSVVKMNWPKYGMDGVIMRVGQVDYGIDARACCPIIG